jgi:hypothetical protein
MSRAALEEAEEAVPLIQVDEYRDRIITSAHPEGSDSVSLCVSYCECVASSQWEAIQETEGLEVEHIHAHTADELTVHFSYELDGGD